VITGTCDKTDCTVATTEKCLLSQPDPATCEHFRPAALTAVVPTVDQPSVAESEAPRTETAARNFHLGNELGTEDAVPIMRTRYTHLIGVLGSTDAGKTCFLSSLYLMASGGTLPSSYKFAGSLSLQAYEDRARGLRQWPQGVLPLQLVDHTILADKRQPSLLHLAIRATDADRRRFDLLLTDLPGEWTKNLALRASNADSFRFLRRADGIILVVDGNVLLSDHRHAEIQRMRYFCERLANEVGLDRDTPFVILVSKADECGMEIPPIANELRDHVRSLGFQARVVLAAAFSRKPHEIPNGLGVFDAIETILSHAAPPRTEPSSASDQMEDIRSFQRFRG
jgi:hypothetical protein